MTYIDSASNASASLFPPFLSQHIKGMMIRRLMTEDTVAAMIIVVELDEKTSQTSLESFSVSV